MSAVAERRPAARKVVLPKTLVDQVAAAILQMAIEGAFAPGSRIREPDIAGQLNVSRVPVREALRLLEADGIVTSEPYKGMRFMEVDQKLVSDLRQVRLQLELLAGTLCLERLGDIHVLTDEMEIHLAAMVEAQQRQRLGDIAQEDIAFHRAICRCSGNAVLLRFWDSAAKQMSIVFGTIMRGINYAALYTDHRSLIDAFLSRDAAEIERALRGHVLTAAEELFRRRAEGADREKGGAGAVSR
jgi:DNA-binding GntR family transcriptional regulator